jgi:hypothetical protein
MQPPAGGPPRDPSAEYSDVRQRIQGLVDCLLDPGSTVAVVSKGDQALVSLESRQGWHFPRTPDGRYAGHHPADGAQAVAHLEQLHKQGADYFLLPSTYFWWLDQYQELAQHLQSRYRLLADCPDTCLIYDLRSGPAGTRPSLATAGTAMPKNTNGRAAENPLVSAIRALLDSLLPEGEPVLVVCAGPDELRGLGRPALHFAEDEGGTHLSLASMGREPISAELTALRARGVSYLVVPDTARQAVERSRAMRELLRERARTVAFRDGICTIYELGDDDRGRTGHASTRLRRLLRRSRARSDD